MRSGVLVLFLQISSMPVLRNREGIEQRRLQPPSRQEAVWISNMSTPARRYVFENGCLNLDKRPLKYPETTPTRVPAMTLAAVDPRCQTRMW